MGLLSLPPLGQKKIKKIKNNNNYIYIYIYIERERERERENYPSYHVKFNIS
jgi:hypothetical protein